MNQNEYNPINFKKVREEWAKKNAEPGKIGNQDREWGPGPIMSIQVPGIKQKIYCSSYSIPYFLDNLEKIQLESMPDEDFEDNERELWKKDTTNNEFEEKNWRNIVNNKIEKNNDKPFEIDLSYSDGIDVRKNNNLDENSSARFFYLPESMLNEINRYNEYIKDKKQKEADEALTKDIGNINLN